ncbi:hypothetical protein BK133_08115 [Paenibacillus sp. FSL H8-0548]|uniref:hypothetical protein n=1 Tax=Paenibacillus sp. FSL H8-0548 TaxID=1920422 RepID=UPI00096E49CB|nr:hypothetical protein [Paenibacillus sp. FSL H8-0548]OMF36877.1 hypothetical protein BK133_08115 [Paenibacillus sp. FSL H8-0548]
MEFTYEIISESNINVRYIYGGEWFTFNLFNRDEQWVLHPFDSSLIRNKDMSRLVIIDLLQHRPFQVMLAKEGIILSELNTSISLGQQQEEPEFEELPRRDRDSRRIFDEEPPSSKAQAVDIDRFIEENDLEDLVQQELQLVELRQNLYNQILHRMFMADLGPTDPEFQKIQQIVKAYGDAKTKLLAIE